MASGMEMMMTAVLPKIIGKSPEECAAIVADVQGKVHAMLEALASIERNTSETHRMMKEMHNGYRGGDGRCGDGCNGGCVLPAGTGDVVAAE